MAEIMFEHTIERAIIMAAGIGQRLRPVTLTTPKPLVTVNGVCMIDTIIAALHENEIHEIYVVVGYLKEQFYEWAKKYNGITLIENPWYAECNNIASLYVAREYLNNAIILDGDQIIRNPAILHREFTRSGYSCAWTDRATNEWLLTVKNGIVTKCSHTGGDHGWQLSVCHAGQQKMGSDSESTWNWNLCKMKIGAFTGMMLQCFATLMSTSSAFTPFQRKICAKLTASQSFARRIHHIEEGLIEI